LDIVKVNPDDPIYKTIEGKKALKEAKQTDADIIRSESNIELDIYDTRIKNNYDGKEKIMIVCPSRASAVATFKVYQELLKQRYGSKIKALVAFSGSVNNESELSSEESLNGIPSSRIEKILDDNDAYKFLICANKFQTGFNQPNLIGMFVHKSVSGPSGYQMYERLNRTSKIKTKEQKTYLFDWCNTIDQIKAIYAIYNNGIKPDYDNFNIEQFKKIHTNLVNNENKYLVSPVNAKIYANFVNDFDQNKSQIEMVNNCDLLRPLTEKEDGNSSAPIKLINIRYKFAQLSADIQEEITIFLRKYIKVYKAIRLYKAFDDIFKDQLADIKNIVNFIEMLDRIIFKHSKINQIDLTDKVSFIHIKSGEVNIKKGNIKSGTRVGSAPHKQQHSSAKLSDIIEVFLNNLKRQGRKFEFKFDPSTVTTLCKEPEIQKIFKGSNNDREKFI
jgi:type I restriction enzyme R subunit